MLDRLVLASNNPGKLREFRRLLEPLGIEVIDVRVKKIDLPPDVSESVYRRMIAEREKEARERRSQGQELAEGIRAAADREVTVLQASAFRDAELVRGAFRVK